MTQSTAVHLLPGTSLTYLMIVNLRPLQTPVDGGPFNTHPFAPRSPNPPAKLPDAMEKQLQLTIWKSTTDRCATHGTLVSRTYVTVRCPTYAQLSAKTHGAMEKKLKLTMWRLTSEQKATHRTLVSRTSVTVTRPKYAQQYAKTPAIRAARRRPILADSIRCGRATAGEARAVVKDGGGRIESTRKLPDVNCNLPICRPSLLAGPPHRPWAAPNLSSSPS